MNLLNHIHSNQMNYLNSFYSILIDYHLLILIYFYDVIFFFSFYPLPFVMRTFNYFFHKLYFLELQGLA